MDFPSTVCNMRASSEFPVEFPIDAIPSPPKRKGGRKPIFTAEARRQRNRDAQTAFRERRIEYIRELEETVKIYGDKLRNLEAARASAADECLMLRYKNSLLERILVYKGVDVQAELKSERWNPGLAPVRFRVSPKAQDHKSIKHNSKAVKTTADSPSAYLRTSIQGPQYLSPVSNFSETSGPSTPPSTAPATHKRTETHHPTLTSYVPIASFRREDHPKVFSSVASNPINESSLAPQEYGPHKSHVEALPIRQTESLTDFLEVGYNLHSLGSLDDFDFSTDYSALTPMSFPSLSL